MFKKKNSKEKEMRKTVEQHLAKVEYMIQYCEDQGYDKDGMAYLWHFSQLAPLRSILHDFDKKGIH